MPGVLAFHAFSITVEMTYEIMLVAGYVYESMNSRRSFDMLVYC